MAFVNEYISEEDKEKYKLDALWGRYHDPLHQKVENYMNDSSIEVEKRLYLASVMQMQGIYLGYDKDEIISSITDTYVQDLVSDIFNNEVNLQVYTDETTFFENDALIIGSKEDDLIQTTKNFSYQNSKATIIAGLGDDRIITVAGDTKYIYNNLKRSF